MDKPLWMQPGDEVMLRRILQNYLNVHDDDPAFLVKDNPELLEELNWLREFLAR